MFSIPKIYPKRNCTVMATAHSIPKFAVYDPIYKHKIKCGSLKPMSGLAASLPPVAYACL